MFQQLFSIGRNTFTESIRQPIFVVLVLVGVLALLLNPSLAAYTMEDDNKLLVDMGLSTIFLVGLLLAAFTATNVLSSEVENKTVLTVISKPVPRPVFVLGKYIGVASAIAVAFYILTLIFMLTLRHRVLQRASDPIDPPVLVFGILAGLAAVGLATWGNYFLRWVFASSFVTALAIGQTVAIVLVLLLNKKWELQSPVTDFIAHDGVMGQVMVGLLLVFEAVLLLTAVAVAVSTRLGQLMTLLLCLAVFLLGLISNSFSELVNQRLDLPQGLGALDTFAAIFAANEAMHLKLVYALSKLGYLLVPNMQFLWPADAITQNNPFSVGYVAVVTAYAALYVAVALCVAVALFQRREVG